MFRTPFLLRAGRYTQKMRILVASAFLACTCFAQKIETEFDHALDFAQFKTFTIREGKINAKNPMLNNELVEKNLRASIVEQLKLKGLSQVESKGELNVTFRLGDGTEKQTVLGPSDRVTTVGPRGRVIERKTNSRKQVYVQAKDILVIDLRNSATKELAWRAHCVDHQDDPAKLEKRLPNMVVKAFQKYPPKKK